MSGPGQVTQLMGAIRDGDAASFNRLFELVYDELHQRAHWQIRQAPGPQTINTTALVHEAYLKLTAGAKPGWEDRRHFYCVAGKAMRQILVDRARRRLALKRGGDAVKLDLESVQIGVDDQAERLVGLDAALAGLETLNERLARIVELRYFAGLSVEDTARALDISERTVKRDWRLARAYLHERLDGAGG